MATPKGNTKGQPRKASAASKASQAKADKAKAAEQAPKRELPPAPKGWATTKGDAIGSFVRYARRVRHTGIAVTAYDTTLANSTTEKRLVSAWRKAGHESRYVVVAHELAGDVVLGSHDAWARAYATSMGMGGRALAPSVVATITPKPKASDQPQPKATPSKAAGTKAAPRKRAPKAKAA